MTAETPTHRAYRVLHNVSLLVGLLAALVHPLRDRSMRLLLHVLVLGRIPSERLQITLYNKVNGILNSLGLDTGGESHSYLDR